jgi:hypothetical protein
MDGGARMDDPARALVCVLKHPRRRAPGRSRLEFARHRCTGSREHLPHSIWWHLNTGVDCCGA